MFGVDQDWPVTLEIKWWNSSSRKETKTSSYMKPLLIYLLMNCCLASLQYTMEGSKCKEYVQVKILEVSFLTIASFKPKYEKTILHTDTLNVVTCSLIQALQIIVCFACLTTHSVVMILNNQFQFYAPEITALFFFSSSELQFECDLILKYTHDM